MQKSLDAADIPWDMVVNSDSTRTVDATVSADLAVHANIAGNSSPYLERIDHAGALPDLTDIMINMYTANRPDLPLAEVLAGYVRDAYGGTGAMAAQ